MSMKNLINLCSLNVNGINSREKRNRVIEFLNSQKCSIAYLQETHINDQIETEVRNTSNFDIYSNHGTTASRGVSILINRKLRYELIDKFCDGEGRLILLNTRIEDMIFTFVCLYAPNCKTARNTFFKKVSNFIKEYGTGIPILGGDFNEIMRNIDRKTSSKNNPVVQSVSSLKTLIRNNNLVDIWKEMHENIQQFTWRRRDKSQASRIDLILVGKDFISFVEQCKIKPACIQYTDHLSVCLYFKAGIAEKGRGYWKINNSILEDAEYVSMINSLLDEHIENIKSSQLNSTLLWDFMKQEIREYTIKYCKNKSKLTREATRSLEKELEGKILNLSENNDNDCLEREIAEIERQLGEIYDQKAKGAQIRAREQWVEFGEKNNSYFLGLEKKRQIKKSINKIVDKEGNIINDQSEILKNIKSYYEKLYTSNLPNKELLKEYIFETELENKLNDEDKSACDGEVTVDECSEAINLMKLNKSPGLDGLTVEFYRKFWDKLKTLLVDIYNNCHEHTLLSYSQRSSVLSLIFKKGDPKDLNNYRPISLLNVDLKILSHVLALRLKKVLPKIINEDQTGYIKNRFIGLNLRQIQDIIDYADLYKIEGAIVFVDFTKAFDSLEWEFMIHTLEHFGFGESFMKWVKTLYTDIQTCVMNNGWLSDMFRNSRGIRQGCPLSALLFVISVEIMALRLRNNKNIRGFEVKIDEINHCIKISQLADDTTLFFANKIEIPLALNEIEIFGSFSGLKINRTKTEGLWIGKLKHCRDKYANINWTDKPVKALGIYFGHDKNECDKLNWEKRIEKMNNLFLAWGKRNLTFLGKILIIKSLVIPIFTYLATVCVVPVQYRKEIESKCFKFIWKGKPDKVKRNTLIGKYEEGGLRMIDIGSYFESLKASWVSRLIGEEKSNWKLIPRKYLNIFGRNWLIFSSNINYTHIEFCMKNIPKFYIDVVKCWVKAGGGQSKKPTNFREIRKQVIWGNKFITSNNKSLFFKSWIDSGLIYINDILDISGKFTPEFIFQRLNVKTDWISEFCMLKKAIPPSWFQMLTDANSVATIVHVPKSKIIFRMESIAISIITNKTIYNELVRLKLEKPISENYWKTHLSDNFLYWKYAYTFIFDYLKENKLRVFRWKLTQYIIPTKQLLYRWKITHNNVCNVCNVLEDYDHYFLSCSTLNLFWHRIKFMLQKCKIDKPIILKYLVFGYKITDKAYYDFNYLLTIIGFTIFKAYYVSEQKTKYIDLYSLFEREYLKRVKNTESTLLNKIKQIIEMRL